MQSNIPVPGSSPEHAIKSTDRDVQPFDRNPTLFYGVYHVEMNLHGLSRWET
jgi:hypothetical protein